MEDPRRNDELKDAPLLRSVPKADPFTVPDGFFERFPHSVQARATARGTGGLRWPRWARRAAWALPAMLLAAVVWWAVEGSRAPQDANGSAENQTGKHFPWDLWDDDDEVWAALYEGDGTYLPDMGLGEHELAAYVEHENLDAYLLTDEH